MASPLIKTHISALAFLFFICACSPIPERVESTFQEAGKNKAELQKVLDHYKNDKEKLEAAYFLIGNMWYKYAAEGPAVRNYDAIFEVLDSLHKNKVKFGNTSPFLQAKWDSLVEIHGMPRHAAAKKRYDAAAIRAEYLICHIDQVFKVWKESSWVKTLTFDQFCEYILPYRIGDEPLEAWNSHLYRKYSLFRDTVSKKNRQEVALALNQLLRKEVSTSHILWSYPFSIPVSMMEKGRRGACIHVVSYTAMTMRANGIPVMVDKVVLWGNRGAGHYWNTLLLEDGSNLAFDGAKGPLEGKKMFVYKFAKVYRSTFGTQDIPLPESKTDVPSSLIDFNAIDVTNEYVKSFDISLPIQYNNFKSKRYAIICTFGSGKWEAQDWGEIKQGKAYFKNMGSDIMYIVMYYDHGIFIPATDPFVLDKGGKISMISGSPKLQQDMQLVRKYPIFASLSVHLKKVVGGRFQGANKPDFSDSVNLFTITKVPAKFEEVSIRNKQKFRYVRYISADKKPANMAEFEVYGGDNNRGAKLEGKIMGTDNPGNERPLKNAFDGDLGTYFTGGKGKNGWLGLSFQLPVRITKFRFCPQNDTNFILPGNTYELAYWDKDKWTSVGKQTATGQELIFSRVPSNRLYILHNLSGGTEERIFTYEKGQQVWW